MVHLVGYTNILYAIPAFIALGIFLFGFIFVLILASSKSVSYHMLRHYVNQTSMGRTAIWNKDPAIVPASASTKEWSEATKDIGLDVPEPVQEERMPMGGASSPNAALLRAHARNSSGADMVSGVDVDLSEVGENAYEMRSRSQQSHQIGREGYGVLPRTSIDGRPITPNQFLDVAYRGNWT